MSIALAPLFRLSEIWTTADVYQNNKYTFCRVHNKNEHYFYRLQTN